MTVLASQPHTWMPWSAVSGFETPVSGLGSVTATGGPSFAGVVVVVCVEVFVHGCAFVLTCPALHAGEAAAAAIRAPRPAPADAAVTTTRTKATRQVALIKRILTSPV